MKLYLILFLILIVSIILIKYLLPIIVFPIKFLPSLPLATNQVVLETSNGRIAILQSGSQYATIGNPQILFCHGNGQVLDHRIQSLCDRLSKQLKMTVVAIDYPGYGLSEGFSNESSVNTALRDVIRQLPKKCPLVLIGQSVGTAPCVEYAKNHLVKGMVLVSPFRSIMRIKIPFSIPGIDMFQTEKHIMSVRCPTLVIHGIYDEIVPYDHGREIVSRCDKATLISKMSGHNDVDWESDVIKFIKNLQNKHA